MTNSGSPALSQSNSTTIPATNTVGVPAVPNNSPAIITAEPVTLDSIRSALFSSENITGKTKLVTIFESTNPVTLELHEPTLGQVRNVTKGDNITDLGMGLSLVLECSYLPNSNIKVFTPADAEAVSQYPYGELMKLTAAALDFINDDKIMNIAEKNSEETTSDTT